LKTPAAQCSIHGTACRQEEEETTLPTKNLAMTSHRVEVVAFIAIERTWSSPSSTVPGCSTQSH
jgi:hypothetical protein